MKPPLKNSLVLLTGASSGIGREMARTLAPEVNTLVLVARRRDRLEELKAELIADFPRLRVHLQPCDLGDLNATSQMLDRVEKEVGEIQVLINNAGMGDIGFMENSSWEKIQQMIQLNVVSLSYLTHRLLKPMIRRGRGGILNVSSGFGLTFMPMFAAYVGTKHYVSAFSESLRAELSGTGVVVTQVCPGPVSTEFLGVALEGKARKLAPDLISVSATRCARSAIRGFARGRALVVPGLLPKLIIGLGRISPAWILRPIYSLAARHFRKQLP